MIVQADKNDDMINLLDLQKEIDELLDKETDDSLLNWYNTFKSKKKSIVESYIGDGDFLLFSPDCLDNSIDLEPEKTTHVYCDPQGANAGNTQYSMAA